MNFNKTVFIQLENVEGERGRDDNGDPIKYSGTFEIKKYLSHAEKSDAVRLLERLCRGIERNNDEIDFLSTVAHLAFHIKESPEWWGEFGLDLIDREPIWYLAEKIGELQNPVKEKAEEPKDEADKKPKKEKAG